MAARTQPIDVVYLYEHVSRELDVACAVQVLAQQHYGISMELVQWPNRAPEAYRRLRPRIVVLPFCYRASDFATLLLHWRSSIFVNLAWEQLLYPANRAIKLPTGDFALRHVLHHAWSETFAMSLLRLGVPANHIVINGQPAYALYDKPYAHYFGNRPCLAAEHGLQPDGKWVFFPENYNWLFYDDERRGDWAERGANPSEMAVMRDFCERSFESVLKWCAAAVQQGSCEIIIRPRPATPVERFRSAVERALGAIPAGIHITGAGTVREWIMASDLVVSSYSTSLIEAAIARKPAYMLAPFAIPEPLSAEWHTRVPHLTTQAEFERACVSGVTDGSERLGSWARASLLGHGDPIANIAHLLGKVLQGEIKAPSQPSIRSSMVPVRHKGPPWLVYMYRLVRNASWARHQRIPVQPDHQRDQVSQEELTRRLEQWTHILSNYALPNAQFAAAQN